MASFGQSAKFRQTLEFQINVRSALNVSGGGEVHYAYRLNQAIHLWNWEIYGGGGFWSREEQGGPHLVGGGRSVFGRKRNQVLGDLGAAYLIDVRNGGMGYVHPVLNLGYRYNPKK
jgi:hypothetical protein